MWGGLTMCIVDEASDVVMMGLTPQHVRVYVLLLAHLLAVLSQKPALLRICSATTLPSAATGPVASGVQARAAAHPGALVEAGAGVFGKSRFATLRTEALRHGSCVSKLLD